MTCASHLGSVESKENSDRVRKVRCVPKLPSRPIIYAPTVAGGIKKVDSGAIERTTEYVRWHLSLDSGRRRPPPPFATSTTDLSAVERDMVVQAHSECAGNKSKAAARSATSPSRALLTRRCDYSGSKLDR